MIGFTRFVVSRAAASGRNLAVGVLAGVVLIAGAGVGQAGATAAETNSAAIPSGYTIVHSSQVTVASGVQGAVSVQCPSGTVVLGGGASTSSRNLAVNLGGSHPLTNGTGWGAAVNNGSGATIRASAWAVCAAKPSGYMIVSKSASDPAASENGATANCPSGSKALGGGGVTSPSTTSVSLNSSYALIIVGTSAAGWTLSVNNASSVTGTLQVFAVCGKISGYHIQKTSLRIPAGADAKQTAFCPSGVVLGGGVFAFSNFSPLDVNINATLPGPASSASWVTQENNSYARGVAEMTTYAICGS
jgi:hypothetical protein